jgi:hypothetical protein
MKKTKTEVYCCEYCGKLYINSQEATACELACKRANKKVEEENKWYAEHKPEYEVGDVVELWQRGQDGYANKFFVVQRVQRSYGLPAWVYSGASGYDCPGDHDPRAVREHFTEDIRRRVMTASEYYAWCEDIRKRLPKKHSCEFSLLSGDEFGLAVSVFPSADTEDDYESAKPEYTLSIDTLEAGTKEDEVNTNNQKEEEDKDYYTVVRCFRKLGSSCLENETYGLFTSKAKAVTATNHLIREFENSNTNSEFYVRKIREYKAN